METSEEREILPLRSTHDLGGAYACYVMYSIKITYLNCIVYIVTVT